MVIIADSGSTKTAWRVIQEEDIKPIETVGINPFHQSKTDIITMLSRDLIPFLDQDQVTKVYFYGAGCAEGKQTKIVEEALQNFFQGAQIHVAGDMLGAARALCQQEAGIACILGTGSNSCLFDGKQIIEQVPSLGYTLGDEGSGAYLGKKLLRNFLRKELPGSLQQQFQIAYNLDEESVLNKVYREPFPSRYLASFTVFLHGHQDHPFISALLFESFCEFFDASVKKYSDHTKLKIHFIGSIAYHFEEHVKKAAKLSKLSTGQFYKDPIEGLLMYHLHTVRVQRS